MKKPDPVKFGAIIKSNGSLKWISKKQEEKYYDAWEKWLAEQDLKK